MKKLFLLFALCLSMLLIFGCSETPQITEPTGDATIGVMVQRPQFIDSRPQTVIEQFTLHSAEFTNQIYKKPPPPPPPDTGSDPNPNPPHKYAYIVGISDYEGTANDLQYCDDDAISVRAYYQSQGFTCRMDLDLNATGDAITAGLQWLINSAAPGDEVAFSYSGHGGKATGYGSSLISADLYYVTHGYVMSYFNAINCSKKLVMLDACVIGDFHDDVVSGTVMATASDGTNSYDVPAFQHGAWTYFWLIGVNDLNKIFAEDAASYAETEMKAWARIYHVRVSPIHTDMYDGLFDM